jgi:hypothetical protein
MVAAGASGDSPAGWLNLSKQVNEKSSAAADHVRTHPAVRQLRQEGQTGWLSEFTHDYP